MSYTNRSDAIDNLFDTGDTIRLAHVIAASYAQGYADATCQALSLNLDNGIDPWLFIEAIMHSNCMEQSLNEIVAEFAANNPVKPY